MGDVRQFVVPVLVKVERVVYVSQHAADYETAVSQLREQLETKTMQQVIRKRCGLEGVLDAEFDIERPYYQQKIQLTGKRRLKKEEDEELRLAYMRFREAQTQFALRTTRANYERVRITGQQLISLQEEYGAHLIHPANAVPGLAEDDERIVD